MISDYTSRLEKATPLDMFTAKYLLGRLLDDPKGIALIREAAEIQSNKSVHFALYDIGNRALVAGNFEDAKRWADVMSDHDRDHPITKRLKKEVMMAQKRYGDLDQYLAPSAANQPDDITLLIERYRLALMQNDLVRAGNLKDQMLAMFRRQDAKNVKLFESYLKSEEAVAKDDAIAFQAAAKLDQVSNHLSVPILKGDLKRAEEIFDQTKNQTEHQLLNASLLYLLAKSKKNDTLTGEYWETIKKDVQTSARTAKTFHEMLAGKVPFKFETARDTYIDADNKRALLLVLADRFPQDAAALKALAAKLNFQRDAYSMAVNKFLKEPKKP
ncbi:MAG: hypothetical protein QM703_18120 [Gemmatales bacterium]